MNEKKQNFISRGIDKEPDWEQLLAMVSSLENRANLCGAFALVRQLESIRKTIMRSNSNKKLIRSIQAKIEKLQLELNEKQK